MAKKSVYDKLYVISCCDQKYLKIGVCKDGNIDKRLKSLQTGNPFELVLEWCEERLDSNKAENYLHRCFQDYHVNGEWFQDISLRQIRSKLMMFHDQR